MENRRIKKKRSSKTITRVESNVRGFLGYKTRIPIGSGVLKQIEQIQSGLVTYKPITNKELLKFFNKLDVQL